jgi:lauroyl/myristoyl acyltransferase
MLVLRGAIFRTVRVVGGVLPVPVLVGLLWPFAFLRAVLDSLLQPGRRPPRTLPPTHAARADWRLTGIRERTAAWLNTAALLWADRFNSPRWQNRIEAGDFDELRLALAERPVILVTVHFGGIFVLPTLLRARGIPTATVVADKLWPIRWWRMRRAELTRIGDLPVHFRSGDARGIMRFLKPGRCLLVAADYPLGEQAQATFRSAALRLSTPPFRLARMTNAAVVPVLVRADGVWRYAVHVGRPVPEETIRAQDYVAAVAHVANELLPIAAARPEQALPLLVRAFLPVAKA